jgi:hypothetical protein
MVLSLGVDGGDVERCKKQVHDIWVLCMPGRAFFELISAMGLGKRSGQASMLRRKTAGERRISGKGVEKEPNIREGGSERRNGKESRRMRYFRLTACQLAGR